MTLLRIRKGGNINHIGKRMDSNRQTRMYSQPGSMPCPEAVSSVQDQFCPFLPN